MSRINLKTATIKELEDECCRVYGTPFGHNIISTICRIVKDRFGKYEADRLFNTYQH